MPSRLRPSGLGEVAEMSDEPGESEVYVFDGLGRNSPDEGTGIRSTA